MGKNNISYIFAKLSNNTSHKKGSKNDIYSIKD